MVASGSHGGLSPARAASSVGAVQHQANEAFTDDAESTPHEHFKKPSVNIIPAQNTLQTSANSISAAPGDSSVEQPADIVTSTPPLALPPPEESSRPTDEQIIAQENSIRRAQRYLRNGIQKSTCHACDPHLSLVDAPARSLTIKLIHWLTGLRSQIVCPLLET